MKKFAALIGVAFLMGAAPGIASASTGAERPCTYESHTTIDVKAASLAFATHERGARIATFEHHARTTDVRRMAMGFATGGRGAFA